MHRQDWCFRRWNVKRGSYRSRSKDLWWLARFGTSGTLARKKQLDGHTHRHEKLEDKSQRSPAIEDLIGCMYFSDLAVWWHKVAFLLAFGNV